jgi:hypothetical protein
MAKVPTGRIVLYVVIGVLVVVAAIFLVVIPAQKQKAAMAGKRVRPTQVMSDAEDLRGRLKLAAKNTEGLAGAPELIAKIEAAIVEFEQGYNASDDAPNTTLTDKFNNIGKMVDELRALKKAAKGTQ